MNTSWKTPPRGSHSFGTIIWIWTTIFGLKNRFGNFINGDEKKKTNVDLSFKPYIYPPPTRAFLLKRKWSDHIQYACLLLHMKQVGHMKYHILYYWRVTAKTFAAVNVFWVLINDQFLVYRQIIFSFLFAVGWRGRGSANLCSSNLLPLCQSDSFGRLLLVRT